MIRRMWVILVLCLWVTATLVGGASVDPSDPHEEMLAGMGLQRSDLGDWYGTWLFTFRDGDFLLWVREGQERPEVKFFFRSKNDSEEFESDWAGRAVYPYRGTEGRFSVDLDEADSATLRGRWEWTVDFPNGARRAETGRFLAYRATTGRLLVIHFDEYAKLFRYASGREVSVPGPTTWTYRKVSRRLAPRDEVFP